MATESMRLSDAEVFELLSKAQESYQKYLELQAPEISEEVMPTYTSANPVGLVVNAVVD